MALLDHPTRRQRIAAIAAACAMIAPIAAYLGGQAWVATAMKTDPVPQGAMVGAYLLFAPVAFLSILTFLLSVVVIAVEEIRKKKRR